MYWYAVYATVLSIAQITYCRKWRSVNNESESLQKKVLACNLRRYPGISMEGSGKKKQSLEYFRNSAGESNKAFH
jgi:hypothetical protein